MSENLFDLNGNICLVTGPTGNLGPIWMSTLEKAGAKTLGIGLPGVDITDIRRLEDIRLALLDWKMMPDIIINNAAIDHPPQQGVDFWTDYEKIIETNLIGAINVTQTFLPGMIDHGGGVIINVGSIQGNAGADWRNYDGFEKPVGYNISKTGLVQLTRSLAVQYGRQGIRSVCISFSAVDTGESKFDPVFAKKFKSCLPLGKFIGEKSLKTTLLYACCCPELTGQQIIVDSGYLSW